MQQIYKLLTNREEQSSCGCNRSAQNVRIAGDRSTGSAVILIYVDSHSFPMIEHRRLPLNAFQDISASKCPLTLDEDETVETLPSWPHQRDNWEKKRSIQSGLEGPLRSGRAEPNTVLPFTPAAPPSSQYRLDLNIVVDPRAAQQRVESTFSTLKCIKRPPLEQDVTVACLWRWKKRPSWRAPELWQRWSSEALLEVLFP